MLSVGMIQVVRELGLTAAVVIGVLGICILMVKSMLKQQDNLIQVAAEQVKSWQAVIQGFEKHLESMNVANREYNNQNNEAHKYQREEHIKQLETSNELLVQAKEITTALGRINGYKQG